MRKYNVAFYYGQSTVSPLAEPSKVVEVEVSKSLSKNDVIRAALDVVGVYPRTYSAQVTVAI